FGLEDAIKNSILCPFEYYPLIYTPTEEELKKRVEEFRKWAALAEKGDVSSEAPYIMASNVLKNARSKIPIFEEFIKENQKILTNCIIFVHSTDFGNEVSKTIHKYTRKYREFFSGHSENILTLFSEGEYDALITCHMISEGIDLKNIKNIILFSSDVQKLETIQRIGRALRIDPNNPYKIANIVDFIFEERKDNNKLNSDEVRRDWLTKLSNVR
ncbi:MAG: helicase-related protein, partial [Candidatus Heimdallarchaeota archaeon]|nr:helicase-related protein [Candidatus Heimdallarchaeota archaeon]